MHHLFLRNWVAAALGVALCACGQTKVNTTLASSQFTAPDAAPVLVDPVEYRINAGDRFRVTVFEADKLSGEHQVEPSGAISMPLIGSVQAAGLTVDELSSELEARYGSRYLRSPDVSIQMTEFTKSLITVGGEVETPKVVESIGPTNLLRAIANAQGLTDTANPHRVVVFRSIDGVRHAAAFDLRQIESGFAPNPAIYNGDEIIVDGSRLKRALRDLLSITPVLGIYQILQQ